MKRIMIALLMICLASPAWGLNYLLNGGQESRIDYQMMQKIEPSANTRKVILNFVVPRSFQSPTYKQRIVNLDYVFSPDPTERKDYRDDRGNDVIEVMWQTPKETVSTSINLTAMNSVSLDPLKTSAPFPLAKELPASVSVYLQSTEQVNIKNRKIRDKAKELTATAKTEFDAVQHILTWVVDHMHFIANPPKYDAVSTFKTGRGNCQNYSHLSAALMRAVGIPVRIVNGVTLKKPYDVKIGDRILTLKMAQSRHSWIEVYFPDLDWVPFDPQGSELFVSNRFIRVEVGIDNRDTEKDGLLKWTKVKGTKARPTFAETIDAEFASDRVELAAAKTDYGPREILMSPRVEASFTEIAPPPPPPPTPKIAEPELKQIKFTKPFIFGNLEFPINEDFLSTRGPAVESPDGTMSARKNFLVETAEYVTTKGQQYAQTFILQKPVQLKHIGLALHKFSDEGQLWIELYKDKDSMPGDLVATSDFLSLNQMKYNPGYAWVDFSFPGDKIILPPGRYWAALGFTGSPIVNWFFTYGKPVGPADGTRYKVMFDETWSRSLAYEFNYRVVGLTSKGK